MEGFLHKLSNFAEDQTFLGGDFSLSLDSFLDTYHNASHLSCSYLWDYKKLIYLKSLRYTWCLHLTFCSSPILLQNWLLLCETNRPSHIHFCTNRHSHPFWLCHSWHWTFFLVNGLPKCGSGLFAKSTLRWSYWKSKTSYKTTHPRHLPSDGLGKNTSVF